jgi:hypothetical protein
MEKIAAVVEYAAHDLGGSFAHDQLVSGDESDDRVRVLLDEFEQLGVDDDGMSIEPGEFDHRAACPFKDVIGREEKNLKEAPAGKGKEAD